MGSNICFLCIRVSIKSPSHSCSLLTSVLSFLTHLFCWPTLMPSKKVLKLFNASIIHCWLCNSCDGINCTLLYKQQRSRSTLCDVGWCGKHNRLSTTGCQWVPLHSHRWGCLYLWPGIGQFAPQKCTAACSCWDTGYRSRRCGRRRRRGQQYLLRCREQPLQTPGYSNWSMMCHFWSPVW